MVKSLHVIKWFVSLGKQPQNYLGASWIPPFLRAVRESKKSIWALRILSLSPHYFFDDENPKYKGMSNKEYLEANFEVATASRENIYRKMLAPYLTIDSEVLDYGCGPGFLAKATASSAKKIYALDISSGAIECAKILNHAANIEYLVVGTGGIDAIPNEQLDVAYSFAVVQHLTDEVFESVLDHINRKLKANGTLLLHIQLTDDVWKEEEVYQSDSSAKGRLKYRIGLHCFGRTEAQHIDIVSKHGFEVQIIKKMEDIFSEHAEEVRSQRLLVAKKTR